MQPDLLLITRRPGATPDLPEGPRYGVLPPEELTVALWNNATLILVDEATVSSLAERDLPTHPHVIVLGTNLDDANIYEKARVLNPWKVYVLPYDEKRLRETFISAVADGLHIIAATGGSGGIGASTLSYFLAKAACEEGYSTLLVDLDPMGCGFTQTQGESSEPEELDIIANDQFLVQDENDRESFQRMMSIAPFLYRYIILDCPRYPDPVVNCALDFPLDILVLTLATHPGMVSTNRVLSRIHDVTDMPPRLVSLPPRGSMDPIPGNEISRQLDVPLIAESTGDLRATARFLFTQLTTPP